jgi:hypothetical protein
MNKFEQWFLRRLIARECRQGYNHREKITNLYKEIRIACEREFFEDNTITLNSFLSEMHEKSLRKPTA